MFILIYWRISIWCTKLWHDFEDNSYFSYFTLHWKEQPSNPFFYFQVHLQTFSPFVSCVIILSVWVVCALDWTAWCKFSSGLVDLEFTFILLLNPIENILDTWCNCTHTYQPLGSAISWVFFKTLLHSSTLLPSPHDWLCIITTACRILWELDCRSLYDVLLLAC